MKKSGIEWQLDLKPVRRAPRPQAVEPNGAPPPKLTTPTSHPVEAAPVAIPLEYLNVINDLRRKVDNLNARLRAIELELAQRPPKADEGEAEEAKAVTAPGPVSAATTKAVRAKRAQRIRKATVAGTASESASAEAS